MSLPGVVHGEAGRELLDAAPWHEQRRPGLGHALLAAAGRSMESIREWPHSGRLVESVRPGREVRRMAIERFRFGIVYVVHEHHAHVVAVVHERRRPRYWIDRVD